MSDACGNDTSTTGSVAVGETATGEIESGNDISLFAVELAWSPGALGHTRGQAACVGKGPRGILRRRSHWLVGLLAAAAGLLAAAPGEASDVVSLCEKQRTGSERELSSYRSGQPARYTWAPTSGSNRHGYTLDSIVLYMKRTGTIDESTITMRLVTTTNETSTGGPAGETTSEVTLTKTSGAIGESFAEHTWEPPAHHRVVLKPNTTHFFVVEHTEASADKQIMLGYTFGLSPGCQVAQAGWSVNSFRSTAGGEWLPTTATPWGTIKGTVNATKPPFTAIADNIPDRHAGKDDPFTFDVAFSEWIVGSFNDARQHALTATNAAVVRAVRVEKRRRVIDGQVTTQTKRWRFTVKPSGDADVTLALVGNRACDVPGAFCTADGARSVDAWTVTVPGREGASAGDGDCPENRTHPVEVCVSDASANESDGTITFYVTLTRAIRPRYAPVRVEFQTEGVTATGGSDYKSLSGTLHFDYHDRRMALPIPLIADGIDEGSETLKLKLNAAYKVGADGITRKPVTIRRGEATGTISNSGPMPSAWLARFGRTVATQVLDAVESRMRAPRTPGAEVSVAGERIGLGPVFGADAGSGGDAAARAERRHEAEAGQEAKRFAEWLRGETDPERRRGGGGRTVAPRELLLGSSFSFAAGEARTGHCCFAL